MIVFGMILVSKRMDEHKTGKQNARGGVESEKDREKRGERKNVQLLSSNVTIRVLTAG